jgi:hypothetical protein
VRSVSLPPISIEPDLLGILGEERFQFFSLLTFYHLNIAFFPIFTFCLCSVSGLILWILLGFLSFTLYYTCKTHRRSLYLKIEPHDPHSAFLYKGTIHFSNLFFLHRWEVSSLGILWIKELWTFIYMYLDAYKHVFLGRNISRNDVLGWVYL